MTVKCRLCLRPWRTEDGGTGMMVCPVCPECQTRVESTPFDELAPEFVVAWYVFDLLDHVGPGLLDPATLAAIIRTVSNRPHCDLVAELKRNHPVHG